MTRHLRREVCCDDRRWCTSFDQANQNQQLPARQPESGCSPFTAAVTQQEVGGVAYMLVSTRFACYPTEIEVIQKKKARCLLAAEE